MPVHNEITGEEAIHQAAYVQTSDPGAVGPNKLWWDTTTGDLKVRNAADTAWLELDVLPNAVTTDPSAHQVIVSQGAAISPLAIRGHASQSANLFTVEDSAETDLVTVGPTGSIAQQGSGLLTSTTFAADTSAAQVAIRKSRSATIGANAVVQSGDLLGQVVAYGADGTSYIPGGALRFAVDGTPGTNDMPGRISLMTTADGASVSTERVRIDSTGMVSFIHGIKLTGIISPAQLTANQDNWAPTGLTGAAVIRLSTDAARNLTGISAQASGVRLLLRNVGVFTVTIKHDVTSTAANRFYGPGAADYALTQKSSVWVMYDTTDSRWYVG